MTESIELKPKYCPFCLNTEGVVVQKYLGTDLYEVGCIACGAYMIPRDTKEIAIKMWNIRELKKCCEKCKHWTVCDNDKKHGKCSFYEFRTFFDEYCDKWEINE